MLKRATACLLSVFLVLTGCSTEAENDEKIENETPYTVSYYYSFADDVNYATQDLQKRLNDFGELSIIEMSAPVTESFAEIPEPENDAKAVSPVHIVMPELDLSQYKGTYTWKDRDTGLEVWACYRAVADMLTDELVKVYVDSSGSIIQYETINLGKYEALNLDEKQLQRKCGTFENEIQQALGSSIFEFSCPVKGGEASVYALFTDSQGNAVISTDVTLKDDGNPDQSMIKVHLYAVLSPAQ